MTIWKVFNSSLQKETSSIWLWQKFCPSLSFWWIRFTFFLSIAASFINIFSYLDVTLFYKVSQYLHWHNIWVYSNNELEELANIVNIFPAFKWKAKHIFFIPVSLLIYQCCVWPLQAMYIALILLIKLREKSNVYPMVI